MNAWKVILATLVIFVAGVVTGGLLVFNTVRYQQLIASSGDKDHSKTKVILTGPPASPWQARNRDLLRRMDRELGLTAEQHQDIEKIIAASAERTRSLWKPIAPMMNKEAQLVRSQIREQLTPEQQKKFDGFQRPRQPQDKEKHHPGTNSMPASVTNTAVEAATNAPAEAPH